MGSTDEIPLFLLKKYEKEISFYRKHSGGG